MRRRSLGLSVQHLASLLLVATFSALHGVRGELPAPGQAAACALYFRNIKRGLLVCEKALDEAPDNGDCPTEVCGKLFKALPTPCVHFINEWLPAGYKLPAETTNGSKAFNLCDNYLCTPSPGNASSVECEVPVSVLRSLDFFQLEFLADTWSKQRDAGGGGTNVAAIVGGVVAGNALIVGLVAAGVWLHRRRRLRRQLQELSKPSVGSPRSGGTGGDMEAGAPVHGSGTLKLDAVDSSELYLGLSTLGSGVSSKLGPAGYQISAAAAAAAAAGAVGSGSSARSLAATAAAAAAAEARTAGGGAQGQPGDGVQHVAALWASAAARGAAADWPAPAPPFGSAALPCVASLQSAAAADLQADEHELMWLGSAEMGPPAGSGGAQQQTPHGMLVRSLAHDPLLSWVNSRMHAQASPPRSAQSAASLAAATQAATITSGGSSEGEPDETAAAAATDGSGGVQHGLSDFQPGGSGSGNACKSGVAPGVGSGVGSGGSLLPVAAAAAAVQGRALAPQRAGSGALSPNAQRLSSGLIDLTPWLLQFEELDMQRPLGEGSFGRVVLAKWRETLVAVKLLMTLEDAAAAAASGSGSLCLPTSPTIEALCREAGLMAALRHPNVVQFIGVCTSPPAVITEYCSKGSLLDVLRGAQAAETAAASLTWVRRLSMALDAAKGMLCLHAHTPPIVHRDLKSPNLLVDSAWRVKVCDFNLSKLLDASRSSSSTTGAMNPRWLAPEILTGRSATAASDVFSFGVVLWELLTWQVPWEGANLYQLVFNVSRGDRLPLPPRDQLPGPEQLSEHDAYVALIERCWAQQAEQRPSFADVIADLRGILGRVLTASAAAAKQDSSASSPPSNQQSGFNQQSGSPAAR